MVPIPMRGEAAVCNWGVWVEVSERDFRIAWARWDDTDQAQEAPFPAVVANSIAGYPRTLGLPGMVQLTGPTTPPTFNVAPDLDHPFAAADARFLEIRVGAENPMSMPASLPPAKTSKRL